MESRIFDVEKERDEMKTQLQRMKEERREMEKKIVESKRDTNNIREELNHLQQYSRNFNLRIYKVPEKKGGEEDCAKMAIEVCKEVGVDVDVKDIENAHRVGAIKDAHNRPIIVRFMRRETRDKVLKERRKLKGRPLSIGEDLTQQNIKLLKKAEDHSATLSAWSSRGNILAKLKNGMVKRVTLSTDMDAEFARILRR